LVCKSALLKLIDVIDNINIDPSAKIDCILLIFFFFYALIFVFI
jgi:hypothetical protein